MNVILRVRTLLVLQLSNYLWIGSDATCLTNEPEIQLTALQGTISYKDNLKMADCSYVFPTVHTTEYDVMLAYVTQIDMELPSGRRCAAVVSIGGMHFCKMPVEGCFLYYTATSRCTLGEIHKIIANGSLPCNKTSFMAVESFPPKFQIKSTDSKYKSVNLDYQYIKCQDSTAAERGESSRLTSATTTPPSVDENFVIDNGTTTASTVILNRQTKCPESFALGKVSSCNASIAIAITLATVLIIIASFFGYQSFLRRRAKFNVNRDEKTSKGNAASSREEVSRLST